MKRVFSVPPSPEPTEPSASPEPQEIQESENLPPPATRPRPSVYVREVTERHRSAIERILAQVKNGRMPTTRTRRRPASLKA